MKKFLLLLSLVIICCSSCRKAAIFDPVAQAAIDDTDIKNYLITYGIKATKDPSGVYYSIVTAGTGAYPNSTSNVAVSYSGTLLDGTAFDTAPSTYFELPNTIKGWQIGVPYINKGGTIMLFIPSALGYGITVTGSIPANSVLIYTITLQGFN